MWLEEAINEDARKMEERKNLEEVNAALRQKLLEEEQAKATTKMLHDRAMAKNTRDTIEWMMDYQENQEEEDTYDAMKRKYEGQFNNPTSYFHDNDDQILEGF